MGQAQCDQAKMEFGNIPWLDHTSNHYNIVTTMLIHTWNEQPDMQANKLCGDQLPLEVLFRLDRLGLWSNNLVRGRGHIRGRSTKEEMEVVLQEELKNIYSGPKHVRREQSPRNFCPRWLETSQSP